MPKHLVFYDGTCGLCHRLVCFILKKDKNQRFAFAPLDGKTAKKYLPRSLQDKDTVILVENYETPSRRFFIESKAIWRVCWLLGGMWKLIGWLYIFPAFLFNWAYRLIARHRHRIPGTSCLLPGNEDSSRFLP